MDRVMGRFLSQISIFLVTVLGGSSSAWAVCPAANQYNFSFANEAAATLSYSTTYTYTATSTALGNQNFTVGFTTNNLTSSTVAGIATPNIGTLITDGVAARNLVLGAIFGARSNAAFTTSYVETTFTFPTAIRDFTFQMNDIDFTSNQFRDWIQVTGVNGATTYNAALTAVNATPSFVLGATTTPVTVAAGQAAGTGTSGNNANTGSITASFIQPVTTIRLRWGNYPLQAGETTTGQQAIGIQQISFCPMPSLTVTKSSTPFATGATDPNRFNIPGSDTVYTLTVTNSNSSPLDLNSAILIDKLPAQMTFLNGDIDGAGPLTTNFEFVPGTTGMSLAASNITYSNNGGTTYAYTPAAGYDTAVNAIRFNPQGTMPANSSFSVKLRTRIK